MSKYTYKNFTITKVIYGYWNIEYHLKGLGKLNKVKGFGTLKQAKEFITKISETNSLYKR